MADIGSDPTLLSTEVTVDTDKAEEGWSAFLGRITSSNEAASKTLEDMKKILSEVGAAFTTGMQKVNEKVDQLSGALEKQKKDVIQKYGDIQKEISSSLDNIEAAYDKHGLNMVQTSESYLKRIQATMASVKADIASGSFENIEDAKRFLKELEEQEKKTQAILGKQKPGASAPMTKDLTKTIGADTETLATTLKGELGSMLGEFKDIMLKGGIWGALLYGIKSAATVTAEGNALAYQFRTISGDITSGVKQGSEEIGESMSVLSQKMYLNIKDVSDTYKMLEKAGLTAGQAGVDSLQLTQQSFGSTAIAAEDLSQNLGLLELATDRVFGLQTGTMAKESIRISQELGESVAQTTEQYIKLRYAARDLGENQERFMNSVMATSKILAQYGIDLGTTTALAQSFSEAGVHGAALQQAMGGVGQLFQTLQSNVGMGAYFAQQVAGMEGGRIGGHYVGGDAIKARYELLTGFGRTEGLTGPALEKAQEQQHMLLTDTIKTMQNVARRAGGTDIAHQAFALKEMFGISEQAAAPLLEKLTPAILDKLRAGKELNGDEKSIYDRVSSDFKAALTGEDPFKRLIKDAIATIVNLLQSIAFAIRGVLAAATGQIPTAYSAFKASGEAISGAGGALGRLGQDLGEESGLYMPGKGAPAVSEQESMFKKYGAYLSKQYQGMSPEGIPARALQEAKSKGEAAERMHDREEQERHTQRVMQQVTGGAPSSSSMPSMAGIPGVGANTIYASTDPSTGAHVFQATFVVSPEAQNTAKHIQAGVKGSR